MNEKLIDRFINSSVTFILDLFKSTVHVYLVLQSFVCRKKTVKVGESFLIFPELKTVI